MRELYSYFLVVAASGYFVCNSTGQPIPTTYRCDDTMDCTDGSDEDDCSELR